MTRTYDAFGRLVEVSGPYDTAGPALTLSYFPNEYPARATTLHHHSAPPGYDGDNPSGLPTTTPVDGEGRAIEVGKTSVVGGVSGTTLQGPPQYDTMGRVLASYQPFFVPGGTSGFVAHPPLTNATTKSYDTLGRVTQIVYPDNPDNATET